MNNFSEVYREMCLLRLKYEHLTEVCKTILEPWPNRDAVGRPIKDEMRKEMATVDEYTGQKKCQSSAPVQVAECKKDKVGSHKEEVLTSLPYGEYEEQPSSTSTAAKEMQLLDEILSRAQKLRAIQPPEDGIHAAACKKEFASRSMKLAASAYGPKAPPRCGQGRTAKRPRSSASKWSTGSKQPSFHSSRSSVGTSQRASKTIGVPTKSVKLASWDNEDLCSQARRSETTELKAKSSPQLCQLVSKQSHVPQKHCSHLPDASKSTSKCVESVEHKTASLGRHVTPKGSTDVTAQDIDHKHKLSQDKEEGFCIQQHGSVYQSQSQTQHGLLPVSHTGYWKQSTLGLFRSGTKNINSRLTMSSKYHRLHSALTELKDHFRSQSTECQGSVAGEHFSQRLVPKETASHSARVIQLQLAQEEYHLLRNQITSITPQEWAVSGCSPWQDVLRIKSKLDSISKRIHTLQEELKMESFSPPPSGAKWSSASSQPISVDSEPEEPFAYSSLKDWQAATESNHRRQLCTCEAELLNLCEQIVLPRASRMHHTDRSYTAVLQSVHALLGMDTTPLFLLAEPQHQEMN